MAVGVFRGPVSLRVLKQFVLMVLQARRRAALQRENRRARRQRGRQPLRLRYAPVKLALELVLSVRQFAATEPSACCLHLGCPCAFAATFLKSLLLLLAWLVVIFCVSFLLFVSYLSRRRDGCDERGLHSRRAVADHGWR